MYTDYFKTFTNQAQQNLEPYVKFNKLIAKNVEAVTQLQINAMQTYSEVGLSQMKAASDIRDIPTLTAFNSQQLAVMSKLSQQMLEDGNKLQNIAKEFKEEMDQLTSENLKAVTPE